MNKQISELSMEELEAVNGCGGDMDLGVMVRTMEISTGGTVESKPVADLILAQGLQTAEKRAPRIKIPGR